VAELPSMARDDPVECIDERGRLKRAEKPAERAREA